MTFSILARDPETGAIGGAAATGSLCVGGWVLRGTAGIGMSASQGKSPSTLWGDGVLACLGKGKTAEEALQAVVAGDRGKAQRQLAVLDRIGNGAAYSGAENTPIIAHSVFENGVAAGNMLAGTEVVDTMIARYLAGTEPFPERLLAALRAADEAGSDIRGLQSAALLILSPDHAPLTLRIDLNQDPLGALEELYYCATTGDYALWAAQVPTLSDPERCMD